LLIDILDPNRGIDSRYVVYQAATRSGRLFTGVLAVDTAASITLRRAEQAEDTILRSQLESLTAMAVSLMPDEIEKLLSKQELADVIAFLLAPTARK
jgi:putative heme-binding domain-containing protein